jgi:hypothetical protein
MTNTLKIAAIAAVVALSMPSASLANVGPRSPSSNYGNIDVGPRSLAPTYRSASRQDGNDPWDGYFTNPQDNPNYHGSNGG